MAEKPTDFKDPVEIDLVDTFSELSTSEEAKKGDLAVIEESPALPPESNWKKAGRVVGKVARAAARRNPLGLLIDTLIQTWPTDEEVEKNFEKVQKENENILDDIATLVKGMKGEPMTRREVLRGGKAAAQVIGTPKPKLITDKVDTPIPVDEYESNFVSNMADELFNIWNDNDKNVFRNIFFTNYSDKGPNDKDITSEDEKLFEESWKESLYFETTPDKKEFVKGEDGVSREINTHKTRLIPDTRGEWDDMRGTWVYDYLDPPTSEEVKEAGRGYFSDWEQIIDEVYYGTDQALNNDLKEDQLSMRLKENPTGKFKESFRNYGNIPYMDDFPYDSLADMYDDFGMKNAKEFEKYIRMLKDKFGLQRYEIYDLWNLGARRYLGHK